MRRRGSSRRAAASGALVLLCLGLAGRAAARPVTLEDLLQQEGVGAALVTPGGRWAAVEFRGPYVSGGRFDYLLYDKLFRTRILALDLQRRGGLTPLFPAEPGVGYQLGPASPDGARLAVFRLKHDRWELGVATFATHSVRWLGVTPEFSFVERVVQWRSSTELVAILRQDQPFELRWMRPVARLPALQARTARGGASVTVVGSGRYLAVRPQALTKRIAVISAGDGRVRTLAHGAFTDLELSADGRWIAVLVAGGDIPLSPDHAVQGPYGTAVRRMRLSLIEAATGRVLHPCPGDDILGGPIVWSPETDEVLVYARPDGAPWPAGRLLRVDAASGAARPAGPAIAPLIDRRPEMVYAGWLGPDPIVLGRPAGGGRDDWYRLSPSGPLNLTARFASPPHEGLVATPSGVLMAADGAAWRISADGRAARLATDVSGLARRGEGAPGRELLSPRQGEALLGVRHTPKGDVLSEIGPDRLTDMPLPPHVDPLAAAGRAGALALRTYGAGARELLWLDAAGARPLGRINTRFEDIDLPAAIPVPHSGPNGEPVTSWLLLPPGPIDPRRPPPLIVAPYLGHVYPTSPALDLLQAGPVEAEALLAAHGYAVLVPSLPVRHPSDGPADRLAAQVLEIVDRAAAQPNLAGAFDPHRLGLWGHSFGGYSTLAIIAQTDRFGAAVAEASQSDLISMHGAFSLARAVEADEGVSTPFSAGWTEDLQGDMRAPPYADPQRYVRNSPALQAQHIHTPLMVVHGDLDNMSLGQAQEIFSALYRQDKDAVLVTYWGEPHIYQSPGNLRDLYRRMFGWFDEHLLIHDPAGAAGPPANPGPGPASAGPRPRPPPPRPATGRRRAR